MSTPSAPEGDRRVVRRAVRAGAAVWSVVAVLIAAAVLAEGGDRRGIIGAVLLGVVAGSATSAGWLLLAMGLDLLADTRPGRRRIAWTVAAVAVALLSPLLVLAAPT